MEPTRQARSSLGVPVTGHRVSEGGVLFVRPGDAHHVGRNVIDGDDTPVLTPANFDECVADSPIVLADTLTQGLEGHIIGGVVEQVLQDSLFLDCCRAGVLTTRPDVLHGVTVAVAICDDSPNTTQEDGVLVGDTHKRVKRVWRLPYNPFSTWDTRLPASVVKVERIIHALRCHELLQSPDMDISRLGDTLPALAAGGRTIGRWTRFYGDRHTNPQWARGGSLRILQLVSDLGDFAPICKLTPAITVGIILRRSARVGRQPRSEVLI